MEHCAVSVRQMVFPSTLSFINDLHPRVHLLNCSVDGSATPALCSVCCASFYLRLVRRSRQRLCSAASPTENTQTIQLTKTSPGLPPTCLLHSISAACRRLPHHTRQPLQLFACMVAHQLTRFSYPSLTDGCSCALLHTLLLVPQTTRRGWPLKRIKTIIAARRIVGVGLIDFTRVKRFVHFQ